MNPLTNVKNITKLNELELQRGTVDKKSWHDMYKGSAWIFIGGLAYDLTEGDVLTVFSQYGEIVNINLVRDKKTGRTKGFCFLCYANQKSSILAVDNFNAIKLCNRTIRVDHVANYKPPKEDEKDDEITKMLKAEGCAPKPIKFEKSDSDEIPSIKKKKKVKKEKKKLKKKRKSDSDNDRSSPFNKKLKIKEEKHDTGYDKYEFFNKKKEQKSRTNKQTETSDSDVSSNESSSFSRKSKKSTHHEKVHYTTQTTGKDKTSVSKRHEKTYWKAGSDSDSNASETKQSSKKCINFDKASLERKQIRDENSRYLYTQTKPAKSSSYEYSQVKKKCEKYYTDSSEEEASKRHKEKEKCRDEKHKSSRVQFSNEYTGGYKEKSKDYRYQKHKEYSRHDRASSDERPHRR